MTKLNIQIDDLVREMTKEEHEAYLEEQEQQAKTEAEAEGRIEAKKSALAKLTALGLTEEEIASL
jgi:hypothetical protein